MPVRSGNAHFRTKIMQNSHYLPTIFIGNLIGDRFVLDCILSHAVRSPPSPQPRRGRASSAAFRETNRMELEVEGLTGAAHANAVRSGSPSATATAPGRGRRAPARWSYASPSCAKAATSRASWNRAGWQRRRWRWWCRRPSSVDDLVKAMGMTGILRARSAGCVRRSTTRSKPS